MSKAVYLVETDHGSYLTVHKHKVFGYNVKATTPVPMTLEQLAMGIEEITESRGGYALTLQGAIYKVHALHNNIRLGAPL